MCLDRRQRRRREPLQRSPSPDRENHSDRSLDRDDREDRDDGGFGGDDDFRAYEGLNKHVELSRT